MVSLRTERAAPTKQERLYYLDWLRALAALAVFYFHTLRPFDTTYWHVKNTQLSRVATILLFPPISLRALPASPRAVARRVSALQPAAGLL